ncbi:hypothetical protein RBB50_011114 [Rhinocladiella similis]
MESKKARKLLVPSPKPPTTVTESPIERLASFHITTDQVQQILDMLKQAQSLPSSGTEMTSTNEQATHETKDKIQSRDRASKIEIENVNEVWNKSTCRYDIKKSLDSSAEEEDEYIEFVAVFRRKFDSRRELLDSFVDIKSPVLRDCLRKVLDGVTCVNLREDKPSVNPDILFTYLPQLEVFLRRTMPDTFERAHLGKLVQFLQTQYAAVRDKLMALLEHREMTFELLPVFFRPNSLVYMMSANSEKPRCLMFDSGRFQDDHGQKYFHMVCRYITHDGNSVGEATLKTKISEFHGVTKISSLGVYPLEYHPEKQEVVKQLTARGKKFLSLIDVHFRKYEGHGFYINKNEVTKFPVGGRVIVDAATFRERNPNYFFPRLDDKSTEGGSIWDLSLHATSENESSPSGEVTKEKIPCSSDDLLICSETVYAFCLQTKRWGELAVDHVEHINWDSSAFDILMVPKDPKEIVQSLVENHTKGSKAEGDTEFDNIIQGKGQNVVILLHGPPGVGKTLTAEAIAEKKKKPLYNVCAGDLGTDTQQLERSLLEITSLAHKWGAIVLIDEADVYLAARSLHDIHRNSLVSVFLRHLEYFQGIMFLTTNRVETFDAALQSRIHFAIKFGDLGGKAKKEIWKTFLRRVQIDVNASEKEIESLSRMSVNGRQIKNIVHTGMELALWRNEALSLKHLMVVIDAAEAFDVDYKGFGPTESLKSYT